MDEDLWCQMLRKKSAKAPACIEVLRNSQGNDLAIDGVGSRQTFIFMLNLCKIFRIEIFGL
jgi:hypothetical protein